MTTVVRWNPFRDMATMQSAFDRFFNEAWRAGEPTFAGDALAVDVFDTTEVYLITAAIPGVNEDQINIQFENGVLTLSAEIPQPEPGENVRVLMCERPFGRFSRSLRLAQPVDIDQAQANYENGVLTLHLPKAEEARPRQIRVQADGKLLESKN